MEQIRRDLLINESGEQLEPHTGLTAVIAVVAIIVMLAVNSGYDALKGLLPDLLLGGSLTLTVCAVVVFVVVEPGA